MEEFTFKWYKGNKGEEVSLDDNYCECETWFVGDYRCSCGNVRVWLEEIAPGLVVPVSG